MAEPLKNRYGPEIPRRIAAMIAHVHPAFPKAAFLRDALEGYEALELMPRGRHIAQALHRHLPQDVPAALDILLASTDAPGANPDGSLASFLFLPHTEYVSRYALGHFEAAMRAQHALTQRFTAEFSIRPFIDKYPERTLALLRQWTCDPSPQVRRLVSEGTRPRLPWAPRLRALQRDPRPALALLERLKDDPELYVRRSVANHLNDIGKDHPALLNAVAKRWLKGASPERAWIVRHALRSAIKRGDPGALAVSGFGAKAEVSVRKAVVTPRRVKPGGRVAIRFELANRKTAPQRVLADLRVHYAKAGGKTSPKVFKLKTVELGPKETLAFARTLSLADLTTRRHHPGRHRVEVLLNGRAVPLGEFLLSRAKGSA
ncbi:MAG: DNA alkylation repair protein [Burkholderiales bacterium]|nr:DNA alkylation repair protein [Burkholderiales bacterium]